jgi:two-component system, NtrC family, sensor histidine kinase HydH
MKIEIDILKKRTKTKILITVLILCLVSGIVGISINIIDTWTNEVVTEKMKICVGVIDDLESTSGDYIYNLHKNGVFNRSIITESVVDEVDSSLKAITTLVLSKAPGIEGGFYSPDLEKFLGYDYPTSPPPIPIYGPPPRSYDIILSQLNKCIEKKALVSEVHQFDPAIFPLVTKPIIYNGKIVGCIWVRIHIERDMPSVKIRNFFSSSAMISIAGFFLIAFIYFRFRFNFNRLRLNIENIENNPDYRIPDLPGVFGSIGGYVNKMVGILSSEHNKRQKLELELIQKDKMATLGGLISGVVHEVKTPLAIIKTRIQIWQQELKKRQSQEDNKLLNDESFKMVVDEIDRLTRLVKRLLAFSKSVSADFQKLRLSEVFMRAVSVVQINSRSEIILNLSDNIPMMSGDDGALEQVFINVLNNAVESMPDGGSVVVGMSYNNDTREIETTITDIGNGIADSIRDKILAPFFTTKKQGVGLGLSICKEIIASHNGRMEFIPNQPQGTIVKIYLPVNNKV